MTSAPRAPGGAVGRPGGNDAAGPDHFDREELRQLSEDLRVMLPGVQVLFGFLLILPFTSSLAERSRWDRAIYFIAFLSAASAGVFFIAPSAHHRLRWREHSEEQVLRSGNRLAVVGTAFLSVSITAVLLLITKLLYGPVWGASVGVAAGASFAWLWYGLPMLHRHSRRRATRR